MESKHSHEHGERHSLGIQAHCFPDPHVVLDLGLFSGLGDGVVEIWIRDGHSPKSLVRHRDDALVDSLDWRDRAAAPATPLQMGGGEVLRVHDVCSTENDTR